jgi:hypothetical protein
VEDLNLIGWWLMEWRSIRVLLAGMIVYSLLSPRPAHAYLDAATGSLIVQMLLAGAVGTATVAKLYWGRITSLWTRDKAAKPVTRDDGR